MHPIGRYEFLNVSTLRMEKWRAIFSNQSDLNSIQQMGMKFSNLLDIRLGNPLVKYRVARRVKRKPIAAKNEERQLIDVPAQRAIGRQPIGEYSFRAHVIPSTRLFWPYCYRAIQTDLEFNSIF
jgi:hypothetical protein